MILFFFFKQKTAYDMRISDWSSDVCSSDLLMLHTVVSQDSHEALESEKFLEDEALSLGARLYHERQDRKAAQEGFDRRDDVAKVIRGSIPIVAEGIRNWVDHFANQGKIGRAHV